VDEGKIWIVRALARLDPASMKIVVVGTGYVGLPAALLLAKAGHRVVGVDIDENLVRAINSQTLLINEVELQQLWADPGVRTNLAGSSTPEIADAYLVAVPTPVHPRKKIADLSSVIAALKSICPFLRRGSLVIIESTVPPLTCREVVAPLLAEETGLAVPSDVLVAHCPERILPGDVFQEIIWNDRIIGGMSDEATEAARGLYSSFVRGELLLTDDVTAELCKLMENTFRDVNIALANEMADVCRTLGVEWRRAFEFANRHPRVSYLMPGIGVGGHCIPVDPWFIKEVDPLNSSLISTARSINDARPAKIAAFVRRQVRDITDPLIVAIGAGYKPNTQDTRESPAIETVELLKSDGYRVAHYDPLLNGMEYSSLAEVAAGADMLCVLVGHACVQEELHRAEAEIRAAMRNPNIELFFG
jgi:UDP-N-acetyl-D-mannosaminuronic acid dehydrogenase